MNKKDRDFININDKNYEEFSFILQEKNKIANILYDVTYYPLVIYQKGDYYYGAFTNFKEADNCNLFVVKCKFSKKHSSNFTVYYNISRQEEDFIGAYLKEEKTIKLIHKYTNMIKKVNKDTDQITKLDNKVETLNKKEDIEELQQIIVEYQNIKQQILSYSYLKKLVLSNWNIETNKIISIINKNINNVEKKIRAIKKKEKIKNIIKAYVIIYLAFAIIAFITIFINNGNSDSDSDDGSDNGFATKCYVRDDGKKCCISCKETSYGDIGCGRVCE